MSKKLTTEEFDKLKSLNLRYQTVLSQIAQLEVKKASILNSFPAVSGELFNFEDELKEKYGTLKFDPQTGEVKDAD